MRKALHALFSLSLATAAGADTYVVTNAANAGPGSLRQAILDANAHPGLDDIDFNLPPDAVTFGIHADSAYVITSPLIIDGGTQSLLRLPITFNNAQEDGFVFDTGSDGSVIRHLEITGVIGSERGAIRISATNVKVADNVIGGEAGFLSTNNFGVIITSTDNIIGGTTDADRNIIGGNNVGIGLQGGASQNLIQGNYIGLATDGKTRRANLSAGIAIDNGSNNTIGGTTDDARNLIASSPAGIIIFKPSSSNIIERNYIGLDKDGEANPDIKNVQGIVVGGVGENRVQRNLISNNGTGIVVAEGFNQTIHGNRIGTDAEGVRALPNGIGIMVVNVTEVRDLAIGGAVAGDGNLISGNTDEGVFIESNSIIRIEGNKIGVDETGERPLPNGVGVRLIASENTFLGGPIARAGNIISGNRSDGVIANRGVIASNLIGLAFNGSDPVPNGGNGITAVGDGAIQIGQTNGGNAIAYNRGFGIDVGGNANVSARSIEFNSIHNNFFSGVRVRDNARHAIRRNSIGRNGGLGIDIAGDGVTLNDGGDSDSGPNLRQNYPVLTGFTATPTQLSVRGTLNSAANTTYTLDFYRSLEADSTGFGEGETYLGSTSVTTNAFGDASFTAVLSATDASLRFVTATATDPSGNTSEFSRTLFIGPGGPPKRRSVKH